MKRPAQGFTLMELMVVLAIAATVLAIGAPSFGEFRRNNRLTGIANDYLGSLLLARTEAIKQQTNVAVCASLNPASAAATCSAAANFTGWIVFVDTNNDCQRNGADVILRGDGPIDPNVNAPSNGACISFSANGFTQPIVGGFVRADRNLFCDDRGKALQAGTALSAARGIMTWPTGRSLITRETGAAGPQNLNDAAWGACP
ncbi:MAG: GspH/FimT family pseudopilin [Steroidobacteraceae bacterium]